MSPSSQPQPIWNPTAALAAWLLPGFGHFILGERRRASILAATIGIIWLAGLLIGGISVVDRANHPAWFLGQMLMAPSVAVDLGHGYIRKRYPPPNPRRVGEPSIFEPSFGQVYEQGMLYTLLAGLLNLLAIVDVVYRPSDRRADMRFATPKKQAADMS